MIVDTRNTRSVFEARDRARRAMDKEMRGLSQERANQLDETQQEAKEQLQQISVRSSILFSLSLLTPLQLLLQLMFALPMILQSTLAGPTSEPLPGDDELEAEFGEAPPETIDANVEDAEQPPASTLQADIPLSPPRPQRQQQPEKTQADRDLEELQVRRKDILSRNAVINDC
jgi:hypothetical protein